MKNIVRVFTAAVLMLSAMASQAQTSLNMTQLGHLTYNVELSEVRGCIHNGVEYALVGANNGFSIVDVSDPTNPTEVFFEQGPNSIWRDPFYHNGYAYCVTEGGGGLLIVDMSPLPSNTSLPTTLYTGSTIVWGSAHNMFIDRENDKAYIFGTDNIDGVIILDISNPISPVELGVWNDHYIHDGFVRGDTLWASCLEAGTFVVDVSIPSNPVVLTSWDTPSEFGHNVWPSDDNALCYTTDEVNSGFVTAYDMSNFSNVVEVDKVRHPLSDGTIPHNAHFFDDYVITSHYRDGVTVHDVSDPTNMVLTGYFDSSPLSGSGFNGAWGAWPYLPSGNLLVSDIEEGLFVLGVDYVRAARLEGTVTEFGTGSFLNDVQIEIISTNLTEVTNLFGNYATGTATAGTYDITFQKAGYIPQTFSGVVLTNGQTITLDAELIPDVPYVLSGTVSEFGTGLPIEGATLVFENQFFNKNMTSDADGDYSDTTFYAGEYDVTIGAWGYVGQCQTISLTSGGTPPNFELEAGYEDDFALDLGWSVSGNANVGVWERDVPLGTNFNGQFSNPNEDAGSNCGNQAFVTGNGGGSAGNDDVDDGTTILLSPAMDLTGYSEPTIQFDYWFFNSGGNDNNPNDKFVVKVDNGFNAQTIASLAVSNSQWVAFSMPISEFITITSSMRLIVETEDVAPGHLVEGGLDNFRIAETTGITEVLSESSVSVFPNPARDIVNVVVNDSFKSGFVQLYDLSGKAVGNKRPILQGNNTIEFSVASGIYLCEVVVDEIRVVRRLSIHQ